MHKFSRDDRGASAVEFALIVSLIFMILFGIVQFGIAYNRYQSINAASREGARLGSIKRPLSEIQNRVLESLSILNANNFKSGGNVVSTCGTLATERGCIEVYQAGSSTPLTGSNDLACDGVPSHDTLTVLVKYRMSISIPLWASPAVTATGTGVFRCEV